MNFWLFGMIVLCVVLLIVVGVLLLQRRFVKKRLIGLENILDEKNWQTIKFPEQTYKVWTGGAWEIESLRRKYYADR